MPADHGGQGTGRRVQPERHPAGAAAADRPRRRGVVCGGRLRPALVCPAGDRHRGELSLHGAEPYAGPGAAHRGAAAGRR